MPTHRNHATCVYYYLLNSFVSQNSMHYHTTGVRIAAGDEIMLPIACDEPSELYVRWSTADGGSLQFVADFVHVNGETVLADVVQSSQEVTLELYGEGEAAVTWRNESGFSARKLAYTVTLTTKREKAQAAADKKRAAARAVARDSEIVALGAGLAFAQVDAHACRERLTAAEDAVAILRQQLSDAEAVLASETELTNSVERARSSLVEQIAELEAERDLAERKVTPLLPDDATAARKLADAWLEAMASGDPDAALGLLDEPSAAEWRGAVDRWSAGGWELVAVAGAGAILRVRSDAGPEELCLLVTTAGTASLVDRLHAAPLPE